MGLGYWTNCSLCFLLKRASAILSSREHKSVPSPRAMAPDMDYE